MGRSLYQKIWAAHIVDQLSDDEALIYIDLHLVHEVTSPQAFEGLRLANRPLRRADKTFFVTDHAIPTEKQAEGPAAIDDLAAREQVMALERNVKEFGLDGFKMTDEENGIVHVVGPEQGLTRPGMTIVCGDSHTSTHGAFGALAHGIGTSEVEHVFATQTLRARQMKNLRVKFVGELAEHVTAKDMALAMIAKIGTSGATGHVLEYCGPAVEGLSMEGRMTLCNMSIEAGARAGLVAPDETTFSYLWKTGKFKDKNEFERLCATWRALQSDDNASYDREVVIDATALQPMVSWGTSPEQVVGIDDTVPDPEQASNEEQRYFAERALTYMGLRPGQAMSTIPIQRVFIGSCTNSRIEDLRAAAAIVGTQKISPGVRAMVVPGSGRVRAQAESEGLDLIFTEAGFEWREPGCSLCLGMNNDQLAPEERCASTSNRNFEGRQGARGRTHLVSPAVAAASAICGQLAHPKVCST